VTYFFNGGEETPFPREERCLIPSPRDVPTYDHKPEMSAIEVTDEVLKRIDSARYDLIVLNFANLDMVGHTGVIPAAIKACETVDACLGRIVARLKSRGIRLIVTADHGNAETMVNDDGSVHTAHTTHQVPLVLVDDARAETRLNTGVLGDIAPTILEIMGLPQPEKMTGKSLIEHR
jgi:2,3-bisphosphoglycerate-independent phosphoglycerate mutase